MTQPAVPSEKIKPLTEIVRMLRASRESGQRVVLANGCFDLVHVGHVRYLEEAKRLGDILIVAINSDDSVRRLKGVGRPLQSEIDRAEMLASFQCVDYVVIFGDPTVDNLLGELRPDVHAKGTDYSEDTVPERQTVLAYGGKTAIVGDAKAHSSRDLIRQILRKYSPE